MTDGPNDFVAGDLAHLSWEFPNTGAGKGEISDEEWLRNRPILKSSLGLMFNLMSDGGETSEALRRFEASLRKELESGKWDSKLSG